MADPPATDAPRTNASWGLFLVVAMVVVIAAALLASTRAKPVVIYAFGYGIVLGIVLRLLADGLNVARRWPLAIAAALIVAGGFVVSFVPSYQKHAAVWEQRRTEAPADPIAKAILHQAAESGTLPDTPPYSMGEFFKQRLPGWPEPWPRVVFGAECLLAMIWAALAMGLGSRGLDGSNHGDANAQDVSLPELRSADS